MTDRIEVLPQQDAVVVDVDADGLAISQKDSNDAARPASPFSAGPVSTH
jgi:hypothetical protein